MFSGRDEDANLSEVACSADPAKVKRTGQTCVSDFEFLHSKEPTGKRRRLIAIRIAGCGCAQPNIGYSQLSRLGDGGEHPPPKAN